MRETGTTGEDRSSSMASAIVPPIVCSHPDDVADVTALHCFRLLVRFHDGVEGEVDMSALVHSPNVGVFAQLADPAHFNAVHVKYGAVTWPGEFDLAPDAMYTEIKAHGKWVLR